MGSIFSLILLLCISSFASCSPKKKEISEIDLIRLYENISYNRVYIQLKSELDSPSKSDYEIFLEACKIYHLDSVAVLNKIQSKNANLYKYLRQSSEN